MFFKKKTPGFESDKEFKARRLRELRGNRSKEEFAQNIDMPLEVLEAYESAYFELRSITLEIIGEKEEIHINYFYDRSSTIDEMKVKYSEVKENMRIQEQKDKEFILSSIHFQYDLKKQEKLKELSDLVNKMGTNKFGIDEIIILAKLAEEVGDPVLLEMIKNKALLVEKHRQAKSI
ncbi:MAG: hypothetical protein N3B21_06580 [Clostridia bacterium]|nr:hypothetical protein [Clostridia bacterium]